MKFQKMINLLDNTPNQPTKFRTKNWVELINDTRERYNTNSQIRLKTSMLRSILCDESDTYILVKGTITVVNTAAAGAAENNVHKKVIVKNSTPLISGIDRINNISIS